MFGRLLLFCIAIACAAMVAPAVAPQLLASFTGNESATATATPETPAAPQHSLARTVTIPADTRGHFATQAVIDGRTVPVTIDTGATTVVLSAATARSLQLNLTPADYTAGVRTAGGVIKAARVALHTVTVGDITLRDISAVVIGDDSVELNLLGLSFLSRLSKYEAGGGQLVLVE